jgi:hypothetical protein
MAVSPEDLQGCYTGHNHTVLCMLVPAPPLSQGCCLLCLLFKVLPDLACTLHAVLKASLQRHNLLLLTVQMLLIL